MADGDVKDLQNLINSIDENSKSTTDNINQILGILQNLDRGGISSNKKNNKKTGADNTSGVISILKAVNNVTPKLHTFSTNISDINRGLKSLSNTIFKFNQGIKSESVSGNKNDNAPRNAAFDSTFFTDVKTVLSDIKNEIADFHKSFKDGLQDISNREVAESKKDAQQDTKAKKLNVKDIRAKQEAGEKLTQGEINALKQDNKKRRQTKFIGNAISGVAGATGNFLNGNIDASSAINKGIDMLTMVSPWFAVLKLFKSVADTVDKEQGYARDYVRAQGGDRYGRAQFMRQSQNFRLNNASTYGFTAEDYLNASSSIAQSTGRQTFRQTNNDISSAIGLKRMGVEVNDFLEMFDTFGRGVGSMDKYFSKLYGQAGKSGLSFKKMTDAIKGNLKLAQTYTFENGINGLRKMAESSVRLKYNMSEVAKFAEKVNTVEGAIKTAAELSVLGGDFAQFSNPMGLLYESLNDMEGLNERMVSMFSRMANWNSQNGQIEISAIDKQFIRRASQAMGTDPNEMMDIAMNRARENRAEQQARASEIKNDELLGYIKNLAQFDIEGRGYIADSEGNEVYIDKITDSMKEMLKNESERKSNVENANMGDIYLNTRSIYDFLNDNLKGVSGKLSAIAAKYLGGSGIEMTDSQKKFYESLSDEQRSEYYKKFGRGGWGNRDKNIKIAIENGEIEGDIDEFYGGKARRNYYERNVDKYVKDNLKTKMLVTAGSTYTTTNEGTLREEFFKKVKNKEFDSDIKKENEALEKYHTGIAGNANEHFAKILRGESVITRRGTDILGKNNVRLLNSGQNPFVNIARNVALNGYDYLKTLSVAPSQYQAQRQQGQQKIAFEPITLTINGQFNVNSAGQFRNIPLDDIDTRALKKAILDTVTENIPSIMRKANILNNRGYDMENDRYRGAIQGSYI